MIKARVFTNLDGNNNNWKKNFEAYFPAVPEIGQTIDWNDMKCHIISVGWEQEKIGYICPQINYIMVVEFNK